LGFTKLFKKVVLQTKPNPPLLGINLFLPHYLLIAQYQGDQIGRIFACWAVVFFGKCLFNTEVA
jgi:hypothetical protein